MRIGIITFPGSLDDVDAARAVRLAGGEPVTLRVPVPSSMCHGWSSTSS